MCVCADDQSRLSTVRLGYGSIERMEDNSDSSRAADKCGVADFLKLFDSFANSFGGQVH